MPYEYGRLSPEDQRKLVELRKQRGYPLHAPPHPYRLGGTYLITAANFEHRPIMQAEERRTRFQAFLLGGFLDIKAGILGWVVLPNHYHVVVSVESLDLATKVIQYVHGATSRAWNIEDGLTGRRKVWYRYTDRFIRNETHLKQALSYIHQNPVKHGYVDEAVDWAWSSLPTYLEDRESAGPMETIHGCGPLEEFGGTWDP